MIKVLAFSVKGQAHLFSASVEFSNASFGSRHAIHCHIWFHSPLQAQQEHFPRLVIWLNRLSSLLQKVNVCLCSRVSHMLSSHAYQVHIALDSQFYLSKWITLQWIWLFIVFVPPSTSRVLLLWPQWATVQGGSSGSQHHNTRAVRCSQAVGAPGSEEHRPYWQWGVTILPFLNFTCALVLFHLPQWKPFSLCTFLLLS